MDTVPVEKLMRDGKAIFLAYDQGFEHGPSDFDETKENFDPAKIIEIAKDAGVFTAIIFHEGIAQKYYPSTSSGQAPSTRDARSGQVSSTPLGTSPLTTGSEPVLSTIGLPPLLLKLNGKTAFHKDEEPYSPQLCTVDEAIRIGASAVGYTIYIGSEHEAKMMQEFSQIEDEAHEAGLPVTMWAYPRGKHVEGKETAKETVAYGARLALEMGADFVKVPYTGDAESFKWVVESAGKVKVLIQGGSKKTEEQLLKEIKGAMEAGATGAAIGRNIWQSDDPVGMAKKIASIVYSHEAT